MADKKELEGAELAHRALEKHMADEPMTPEDQEIIARAFNNAATINAKRIAKVAADVFSRGYLCQDHVNPWAPDELDEYRP